MPKEIERKFLVDVDKLKEAGGFVSPMGNKLWQYYLVATKDFSIRMRTCAKGTYLTIKHGGDGMTTNEEEFQVAFINYMARAEDRVGREIIKTRYEIMFEKRKWEVDFFEAALDGLVVAEIECKDAASITNLPPWVTKEVTFDYRFKNAVLATSDEWKEAIA